MPAFKIGSVYFIVYDLKTGVEFRCSIGAFGNGDEGFAIILGEETYRGIRKPRYLYCSSESCVDRGRFAAGYHAAVLLNEHPAFPMLTATETV